MPTVTEKPVRAYAHCPDPRCPGNQQEEVEAIEREVAFDRLDPFIGGDVGGTDRSSITAVFANSEDVECQYCAESQRAQDLPLRVRELSLTPRKQYAPVSGFPQDGLLRHGRTIDPNVVNTKADEEIAALKAENAKTQAMLAQLLADKSDEAEAA